MEGRLASLGVQYMIVPSLRQLLGMWRDRFGYMPLTLSEAEALDNRIVSPDTDSAQLLKKCLAPRCSMSQSANLKPFLVLFASH